jgi:hypothetical protein
MRSGSRKSQKGTAEAVAPPQVAKAASGRGPSTEGRTSGRDDPAFLGAGRPLDHTTRAYFEPRFGRSLADVRLFGSGDRNAFARGSSIAVPGGGAAEAGEDRSLLAHELAHVVQQRGAPATQPTPVERATAEEAADRAATRLMAGESAGAIGQAPHATYFAPPRRFPAEIPAGRRVIIQWGDDDATTANVEAFKTGARSGPNAAGADTVIHYRDLKPGMLKDFREVVVVIHGETEIDKQGSRVLDPSSGAEPWEQQPRATHGAPGLPNFDEMKDGKTVRSRGVGPMEAVAPEGMAKTLTSAGFGGGRWKTYRLRLAMCFGGVGKAESYSSRVGAALAGEGVEAETHGLTGAVNATGKNYGDPLRFATRTGATVPKRYANPEDSNFGPENLPSRGKPVADNYYSAGARNSSLGVPGTRVRIDRNAPVKPPIAAEPPDAVKPALRPQVPAEAAEAAEPSAPTQGARSLGGGARGFARSVGGGLAQGGAMLAIGYLGAYLRSKTESNEITRDLAGRSAEIETLINARAAEIEKLAQDSTADKVYVQLEVTLLRGRSFLQSGVHESIASVGQIHAIGTSVTPIEQGEHEEMGATVLDNTFTRRTTFVTSVPVRDLALERRAVADRKLAEAAEKLRAVGPAKAAPPAEPRAAAPAPATVAPVAPVVGPQLAPGLQAPAPEISLLPGAPQRMPTPQERMAGAAALGRAILSRGNKVLRDTSATKDDRVAAAQDIKRWILQVEYQKAAAERGGLSGGLAQQLLDDPAMPGPELKQLLIYLE